MPHRAVRDAVLVLDDKSLSLENLKAIKHFTPSTEEVRISFCFLLRLDGADPGSWQMEAIRNFDGDITSLAASDQYLNEVRLSLLPPERRLTESVDDGHPAPR